MGKICFPLWPTASKIQDGTKHHPGKRDQAHRLADAPDFIVCPDRVERSIIWANPAAVGIPVAACAIDADAVAATPASAATVASAAADNHATAAEAATAESAATEAATATETTAAAAAATTTTAAAAGVSRRARCGQHQRRSADDAEAVDADQGKCCQPACEKVARSILSHFDLPVGEAVRPYRLFC